MRQIRLEWRQRDGPGRLSIRRRLRRFDRFGCNRLRRAHEQRLDLGAEPLEGARPVTGLLGTLVGFAFRLTVALPSAFAVALGARRFLEKLDALLDQLFGARHILDGGLQMRARLVDCIDRLIRTHAVLHELVGELYRGAQRFVGDEDVVMPLEAFLARDENLHRLQHAELADHDFLKATLERGIALDPLLILRAGRRAHDAKVAAHERRLEHVRGVHRRADRRPLADQVVQLIDEQNGVGGLRGL